MWEKRGRVSWKGVGVPLGYWRPELKDMEMGTAERSAWESRGERKQVGMKEDLGPSG